MREAQEKRSLTPLWAALRNRLRPQYPKLLLGLMLALMQSALAVPMALLLRMAFDRAIPQRQTELLLQLGLLILALRVASALLACLGQNLTLGVTRKFSNDLRRELLTTALRLPKSFYQPIETGPLQRVLTFDTERVDLMMRSLLGQVLPSGILSLALAAVLLTLNLKLFLLMLVVWPATWLLNEYFRRKVVVATRLYNKAFWIYGEHCRWLIQALDFVRIHHAEAQEQQRSLRHIESVDEALGPMASLSAHYLQLQSVLLTALSLVVLAFGGLEVAAGRLSLGDLLSFFAVVGLINASLRDVAAALYHVFVGTESYRNIQGLLAEDQREPYCGDRQLQLNERLHLNQVHFSYSSQPLLENVSLGLQKGRWLALMGPNGCGKSTVVSLLLGFIAPTSGAVLADDLEYSQLDIGHLRAQIGVVTQEPLLFGGTIFENIVYAGPDLTEDQVLEALRLAAALDWVETLPEGIHTPIGEMGKLLSGGQRQKLALARALVRRPAFLILDEPTNHLDLRAISEIFQNLRALPRLPGLLVVTHDEGIIHYVDEVYRLDRPPVLTAPIGS